MEHADDFNTIHHCGRLFQQYLADVWYKAEKEGLDWIQRNQTHFRAELLAIKASPMLLQIA